MRIVRWNIVFMGSSEEGIGSVLRIGVYAVLDRRLDAPAEIAVMPVI